MNLWDFKVSLVYTGLYSEFQARQNYIVKLYLKKLNSHYNIFNDFINIYNYIQTGLL